MYTVETVTFSCQAVTKYDWFSGVAKGERGGATAPPPNRKKNHSLKKAKSVEKLGGGGTRYIPEAETD